jgi:pyruvate formate lyase activating enzyme
MIGGIQPCSFIDFPGNLAVVVFFQGCNLSCSYCHNSNLIHKGKGEYSEEDLFSLLLKRKKLITGVVFSGGEPTLHSCLREFLTRTKSLGFLTKLDTNGMLPDVVEGLIYSNLVDYLAVDLKLSSSSEFQSKLGEGFCSSKPFELLSSVSGSVQCEARTTVLGEWHTEQELMRILSLVLDSGVKKWHLQRYIGKKYQGIDSSLLLKIMSKATELGIECKCR